MEPIKTYALQLIFFGLLGVVKGAGAQVVSASQAPYPSYQAVLLILFFPCYVYAVLVAAGLNFGSALYVYLPLMLMWWGGSKMGQTMVPFDWTITCFHVTCFVGAVSIFHAAF